MPSACRVGTTRTPTRAIMASQKSARRSSHSWRILPTFIMPVTATMTMAPRVASGSGSKSGVRKSATRAVAAGGGDERGRRPRAGIVVGGRLGQRGADGEPGEQAGARVGGADGDELTVRVDAPAVLAGELVGGTDGLGEGHQGDADRAHEQQRHRVETDTRQRRRRQPGRQVAHHVHAGRLQPEGDGSARSRPAGPRARPARAAAGAPAAASRRCLRGPPPG